MISSFRLPDLVLGVSIRADVTGARQAARNLKNAVGRELGTGGGTTGGGGGGGFGGGLLGGLLGAGMMGGGKGGQTSGLPMSLSGAHIGKIRSKIKSSAQAIATTVGTASAGIYDATQIGRKARKRTGGGILGELGMQWGRFPSRGQRRLFPLFGKASRGLLEKHGMKEAAAGMLNRQGVVNLVTTTSGIRSTGSAGGYWASSLAGGTGGAGGAGGAGGGAGGAGGGRGSKFSPRMFSRIGRMAGLGGLGSLGATMMMVARFLGPLGFALIAAALAFKMAMSFVVSSLTTATDWIKKMGITTGSFGNFSAQLDNFTVVWRNLKLEFGLMLIEVFDLGNLLQNIVPIFVALATVIKKLAENKVFRAWMKLALMTMQGGTLLHLTKFGGYLGRKQKNTGEERIGQGTATNMSPAALEGSAEASRIVNQAVMMYQAETARNTRRCADTLQEILNRAPELGVVPG